MGSWILDTAEAEGRRKERLRFQKEEEKFQKELALLQKEAEEYQIEREGQKLFLFCLVSKGKLELDDLVEMFELSKEELEKEYRDFQLA
ncbi:MAG: hypothetical protein KBT48_00210 [Firmicutes bacterium]|nr:hypothetical protein [Bacillota bacterium]